MEGISQSVTKKDHGDKVSGKALYVDDLRPENLLYGRILRAAKPCAVIAEIRLPELPENIVVVDYHDIPGETGFPSWTTIRRCSGEPRGICRRADPDVVGPDQDVLDGLLRKIEVVYREETPVLDVLSSTPSSIV
jgi:CO/xanthine dehydrogenase Mo-binding subunit